MAVPHGLLRANEMMRRRLITADPITSEQALKETAAVWGRFLKPIYPQIHSKTNILSIRSSWEQSKYISRKVPVTPRCRVGERAISVQLMQLSHKSIFKVPTLSFKNYRWGLVHNRYTQGDEKYYTNREDEEIRLESNTWPFL